MTPDIKEITFAADNNQFTVSHLTHDQLQEKSFDSLDDAYFYYNNLKRKEASYGYEL